MQNQLFLHHLSLLCIGLSNIKQNQANKSPSTTVLWPGGHLLPTHTGCLFVCLFCFSNLKITVERWLSGKSAATQSRCFREPEFIPGAHRKRWKLTLTSGFLTSIHAVCGHLVEASSLSILWVWGIQLRKAGLMTGPSPSEPSPAYIFRILKQSCNIFLFFNACVKPIVICRLAPQTDTDSVQRLGLGQTVFFDKWFFFPLEKNVVHKFWMHGL